MSDPRRLLDGAGRGGARRLGRALLESAQDTGPGPDQAQRDAMWGRLATELTGAGVVGATVGAGMGRLAAGANGTVGANALALGAKAVSLTLLAKGLLVVAVACLVAAAGAAGFVATRASTAPHEERVADPSAAKSPNAAPAATPPQVATLPAEPPPGPTGGLTLEDAPPVAQVPAPAVRAHAKSRPPQVAALASPPRRAEGALLLDARTALKSGDCEKSLALLSEARTRFPAGPLAEEREVLAIRSLDRAGRPDEAEGLRASFARRFPGSAYDVRSR